MGYYIDLKKISIAKYKEILKKSDLIPSRMMLKDDIDAKFEKIEDHNYRNLEQLQKQLKDKSKLQENSQVFNIPERYLEILRAELNGLQQKPNRIKDFSCLDEGIIQKLEVIGIKNTLKLYDEVLSSSQREELSKRTGINIKEIIRLTKLTDLSRIRWVNHTFAYVLYESGYDTLEKVARADYKKLYKTIKELNKEKQIYNAHIGENDMKLCIESAKNLSIEIVYD